MRQTKDSNYVEQEFEDLQRLMKQHSRDLLSLDTMQAQLHSLNQFQSDTQTIHQKLAVTISRMDRNQRSLKERNDQLETRLQQMEQELQQFHRIWQERGAHIALQGPSPAADNAPAGGVRQQLEQAVSRLEQAQTAMDRRLEGLDMRFSKLYNLAKSTHRKTHKLVNTLVIAGLVGIPASLVVLQFLLF